MPKKMIPYDEAVIERLNTPKDRRGRADIRAYIKRRMKEENVSSTALAQAMGLYSTNLCNALIGKLSLSRSACEQIIWILDGPDGPLSY